MTLIYYNIKSYLFYWLQPGYANNYSIWFLYLLKNLDI